MTPEATSTGVSSLPRNVLIPTTAGFTRFTAAITAATTLTGFRKDYQSLYRAKLNGVRKIDGQTCFYLELTPSHNDGNVAKTFLWINEENYTMPKLITQYRDGSWIEVKRTYRLIQNHLLVQHIEASMDFTKSNLEANVSADYNRYKLNQGLQDSLFDEPKKP